MDVERARESLRAAELCLQENLVNSAASRAYYAMFQATHVALALAGLGRSEWSHPGLQATFTTELIRRQKEYPSTFRDYLSSGLRIRHIADYGAGVSRKIATRWVRRAAVFVSAVERRSGDGSAS